jgi:hypothetical protein
MDAALLCAACASHQTYVLAACFDGAVSDLMGVLSPLQQVNRGRRLVRLSAV